MYKVVYMGVMGGLPVSLFGKSKAWPRLIHARGGGRVLRYISDRGARRTFYGFEFVDWYRFGC